MGTTPLTASFWRRVLTVPTAGRLPGPAAAFALSECAIDPSNAARRLQHHQARASDVSNEPGISPTSNPHLSIAALGSTAPSKAAVCESRSTAAQCTLSSEWTHC